MSPWAASSQKLNVLWNGKHGKHRKHKMPLLCFPKCFTRKRKNIYNRKVSCTKSKITTHVPDMLAYDPIDREIPYTDNFHGVLLFADISGFTALTEKFSLSTKKGHGVEALTQTLNGYIEEIVSHILVDGGDVLNYAGDAILALWKVEGENFSDTISKAVKCSLKIQDKSGVRKTKIGCKLRVKIGISAGKLSKVIVGNEVSQYFVVIGRAVDEVRLAEGLAVAGSIILSPNAWELCDQNNILVDPIENEWAVKVRFFKKVPTFSTERDSQHENEPREYVRKASCIMMNAERDEHLRKYIMKTVLEKIDEDQPLEHLSELRPATVVFVNFQFNEEDGDIDQCFALHKAAAVIDNQMTRNHGRINKVFMFDKGCTFLCLFGLPGEKREDESALALQAGHRIHTLCLRDIPSLKTVSVGVTTGPVFCGIVGHPLRHEYTVIGRKVNLAARLMMYYPGVVSCDDETLHYSKLNKCSFIELPKKALKGVQDSGPVHQFVPKKHHKTVVTAQMLVERVEGCPILGRDKELEVFSNVLKEFLEARESCSNTVKNIVMFEGSAGYGKSCLLTEIAHRTAKEGVRVVSFELSQTDIKRSKYTLQTMLAFLLSVEKCRSFEEREKALLSNILDPSLRDDLCLLNDILLVQFPISEKVSLMDSQTKTKEMINYILKVFVMVLNEQPCLFVLDQAQFVDQESWRFIQKICKKIPVLMCMAVKTLTSQNVLFPELRRVIENPRTMYLQLPALKAPSIAKLACQMLGASIPTEVELCLIERSNGVPYYCKEYLKSLHLSNRIVIKELEEDENKDATKRFPKYYLGQSKTARKVKEFSTDGTRVCCVQEKADMHDIPIPITLKGLALTYNDQLQTAEQVLVKYAAVIGNTFTTKMLQVILPDTTAEELNRSLVTLFKSGTFECASKPTGFSCQHSKDSDLRGRLNCYCSQDGKDINQTESAQMASLDGVWCCCVMRFCRQLVQETVYGLWLSEQKTEIHWQCVGYLAKKAHRCSTCSAKEFIFGHQAAAGKNVVRIPPEIRDSMESIESLLNSEQLPPQPSSTTEGSVEHNQVDVFQTNSVSTEDSFLATLERQLEEYKAAVANQKKCSCEQVVDYMLHPMLRHWMAVGNVSKAFYYLLEMVAAYVYLSNNFKALVFLDEAITILNNLNAGNPAFEMADPEVKINNFERACVFRLKGEVQFNMGQFQEAEQMFLMALKLLNKPVPKNRFMTSIKSICETMKSACYRSWLIAMPKEKRLAFLHEQTCCLSYMWKICCMRNKSCKTSLAITMEQNAAMLSAEDFQMIFSSIDYLQYCQMTGQETKCRQYEDKLSRVCMDLPVTTETMTLICHFVCTLSAVKLCTGALNESIHLGLQAQKVGKLLNRPGQDLSIMEGLRTPLLLTCRFSELIELTLQLEDLENDILPSTVKGWFYAACLDILLHAGFSFRPFEECLSFVEESELDPRLVADKSLMMNLHSSLAVWYARLCDWEKFNSFYTKVSRLSCQVPSSINSLHGFMNLLECTVLLFRRALTHQDPDVLTVYKATQKLFREIRMKLEASPVYKPRFFHLKAYMYELAGHSAIAKGFLEEALKHSQKHGNKLEENWIRLSQDAWLDHSVQYTCKWYLHTLRMPCWNEASHLDLQDLLKNNFLLNGVPACSTSEQPAYSFTPGRNDRRILKR